MPTAMIHAPIVLLELFAAIQVVRFWRTIHRFGYFDSIVRQFYPAFLVDCMLLFVFMVQLALALHDWTGLPLVTIGIQAKSTTFLTWLTFGSFLALVWMYCRGRLDHDSAHRTIAALKFMSGPTSRIEI